MGFRVGLGGGVGPFRASAGPTFFKRRRKDGPILTVLAYLIVWTFEAMWLALAYLAWGIWQLFVSMYLGGRCLFARGRREVAARKATT